jgi:hypothetical protein
LSVSSVLVADWQALKERAAANRNGSHRIVATFRI